MKSINRNARANLIVPNLVICVMIVFFYSCGSGGSGGSGGSEGSSRMGSLSFKLEIRDTKTNMAIAQRQLTEAEFNCGDVDTIVAQVFDQFDELLAEGGPFNCTDRQGDILGVDAGDGRIVEVFAINSSGEVIFAGESKPFSVIAGRLNDVGLITLLPEPVPIPPDPPILEPAIPETDQITLRWLAVADATTYNIYISTSAGVSKNNFEEVFRGVEQTSFIHSNLQGGESFFYVVTAQNDIGESDESNEISATVPIIPPPPLGVVEGVVNDAITNSPLEDVTIDMFLGGSLDVTGLTDSMGFYSLDVPPASGYTVDFSKAGFLTETYYNVSAEDDIVTTLETVRLINEDFSGAGNISGTIVNALDGTGVSGLTVELRDGINATSGQIIIMTTTVNDGMYSFENLDAGNYTAEVGGSGFIANFFTVISIGERNTPNQDASITPVLSPGETRIILKWGQTPEDLDAHLTGPLEDESRFHMYWATIGDLPGIVTLDLDDRDGDGPETITIIKQIDGVYRFSVHDYTNRNLIDVDDLANSGAQVKVFRASGLLATFNVPVDQGGTLWTVFELSGDTITPINSMSYEMDPGSIP